MKAEAHDGLGRGMGVRFEGIREVIVVSVLESIKQWVLSTRAGITAKVLLDAGSAVKAGASAKALVKSFFEV